MINYRKYQVIATISIGIFIVCFAIIVTAMNRGIYTKCVEQADDKFYIEYVTRKFTTGTINTNYNKELASKELNMNYDELGDAFCSYFEDEYEISGNMLLSNNIEGINAIKVYYRWSIWMAVFSIFGIIYSHLRLYKGRYYGPFFYGGILGALFLALQGLSLIISDNVVVSGLREMIFHNDYSFFEEGDMLLLIIPQEYAGRMAVLYFAAGFAMVCFFFLLRGITLYKSRPHRF